MRSEGKNAIRNPSLIGKLRKARHLKVAVAIFTAGVALYISYRMSIINLAALPVVGKYVSSVPSSSTADRILIPLHIDYAIEGGGGGELRQGRLGDTCRSGDVIHLSVTAGSGYHVMVFCIDSMMVPIAVFPGDKLSAVTFAGGRIPVASFSLNEVTGTEIYYAIASLQDFSFEEVAPFLDTTLARLENRGQKGPSISSSSSSYGLRLPSKFTYDYIYFRHLGAPKVADPRQ